MFTVDVKQQSNNSLNGFESTGGRAGGAMVLGKLPVPGRPTLWITVEQGATALAVGAGGGCLDIFTLIYHFSPLSPSLWETARYRLKYCLKGPLNPKQPTMGSHWSDLAGYPRKRIRTTSSTFTPSSKYHVHFEELIV